MGKSNLSQETRKLLAESFQPTDDVIVVLKDEDNVSAGGIVLAEPSGSSRDRFCKRAYVLSVGPGRLMDDSGQPGVRQEMPCQPGQEILVAAFSGLAMGEEARKVLSADLKGSEILLIRSHDVLAVCK